MTDTMYVIEAGTMCALCPRTIDTQDEEPVVFDVDLGEPLGIMQLVAHFDCLPDDNTKKMARSGA